MATLSAKEQVRALLDVLPDDASWDDILYAASIRRSIELGLADVAAGRVVSHEDVRREFGISR
jgi:hypothetical protein